MSVGVKDGFVCSLLLQREEFSIAISQDAPFFIPSYFSLMSSRIRVASDGAYRFRNMSFF
jgi:hypothetical protein